MPDMENFPLPMPDQWLRQQKRKARHEAIATHAAEMAGTEFDLDADLEIAAIEHITRSPDRGRK